MTVGGCSCDLLVRRVAEGLPAVFDGPKSIAFRDIDNRSDESWAHARNLAREPKNHRGLKYFWSCSNKYAMVPYQILVLVRTIPKMSFARNFGTAYDPLRKI